MGNRKQPTPVPAGAPPPPPPPERGQVNADLVDLLQRMHDRLTDGRDVPGWMSGWAEEIDAAIAKAEGR